MSETPRQVEGRLQTSFSRTFTPSPELRTYFKIRLDAEAARRTVEMTRVRLLELQGWNAS